MTRWAMSIATAMMLLLPGVSLAATTSEDPEGEQPSGGWGNAGLDHGGAEAEVGGGWVDVEVTATTPAAPGSEGTVEQAGEEPEAAPEGQWISVSDIVFVTDPPCVRMTSQFIEGATADEAEVIRRIRENHFVVAYEAYISAGNEPPQPCDPGEGTPGVGPTPSQQFTDSAEQILPAADPTISGGYAITGLRSWLELGRESSLTTTHELDLGGRPITATITATAIAAVDWGDGTVTTHTSRGGGYHDGEPGPDDITHTYRDSADSNRLTVTDTWDVTISFPGQPIPDITLSWTADPTTLTFPIREVRSTRDQ